MSKNEIRLGQMQIYNMENILYSIRLELEKHHGPTEVRETMRLLSRIYEFGWTKEQLLAKYYQVFR